MFERKIRIALEFDSSSKRSQVFHLFGQNRTIESNLQYLNDEKRKKTDPQLRENDQKQHRTQSNSSNNTAAMEKAETKKRKKRETFRIWNGENQVEMEKQDRKNENDDIIEWS